MLKTNFLERLADWLWLHIIKVSIEEIGWYKFDCCYRHELLEESVGVRRDFDHHQGEKNHDLLRTDHFPNVLHRDREKETEKEITQDDWRCSLLKDIARLFYFFFYFFTWKLSRYAILYSSILR